MIGISAPVWLLGLLLLPLLRELHRRRGRSKQVRVPALFLWSGATSPQGAGSQRSDPDPIWRRRALLIGLLLIALAGPVWHQWPAVRLEQVDTETTAEQPAGNLAVTALSARTALADPGLLMVQVRLGSGAGRSAPRTLIVTLGGRMLRQEAVYADPASTLTITTELLRPNGPGDAASLQARLIPADAVPADDAFELDLGPLRRLPVQVGGGCGAAVRAALAATGRITLVVAMEPALRIRCGGASPTPTDRDVPLLWLAGRAEGPRSTAAPLWTLPAAEDPGLQIGAGWRAVGPKKPLAGTALLASNGRPLILERSGSQQILVLLDTADPQLAAGATLVLLLDWLIARLTDSIPLDGVTGRERTPAAYRDDPDTSEEVVAAQRSPLDLAPLSLLAALALTLAELRGQRGCGPQ